MPRMCDRGKKVTHCWVNPSDYKAVDYVSRIYMDETTQSGQGEFNIRNKCELLQGLTSLMLPPSAFNFIFKSIEILDYFQNICCIFSDLVGANSMFYWLNKCHSFQLNLLSQQQHKTKSGSLVSFQEKALCQLPCSEYFRFIMRSL